MWTNPPRFWTLEDAVNLCCLIEAIAPKFGCHVALTGGCLYKSGPRKDLDVVFYRVRSVEKIDLAGLFASLDAGLGIRVITPLDDWRWVIKATSGARSIDFFFPEAAGGDYDQGAQPQPDSAWGSLLKHVDDESDIKF